MRSSDHILYVPYIAKVRFMCLTVYVSQTQTMSSSFQQYIYIANATNTYINTWLVIK